MREPWFHLSPLPAAGTVVALDAGEARHASGARRLATGDRIVLFDGEGVTAAAELVTAGRREVSVRLLDHERHPLPEPELHLACALPKGDRLSTLLSMSTQLGLSSFTPLACANSVVHEGEAARGRWARILREACKQSRRPHLPRLNPVRTPDQLVAELPAAARLVALDPAGRPAAEWLRSVELGATRRIDLLVGPEGGFTTGELEALERDGAGLVSLGENILRIETAAVSALAIFSLLRERG